MVSHELGEGKAEIYMKGTVGPEKAFDFHPKTKGNP